MDGFTPSHARDPRPLRGASYVLITACLLAGAAASIAVAWGCVLWAPFPPMSRLPPVDLRWPLPVPESWPAPGQALVGSNAWLSSKAYVSAEVVAGPPLILKGRHVDLLYAGFPFSCLRCGRWLSSSNVSPASCYWSGIEAGPAVMHLARRDTWERGHLPTSVVWPGFLADSGLLGGVCLVITMSIRRTRATRRLRKGMCQFCGYELTASSSAVCPECGRAPTTTPAA